METEFIELLLTYIDTKIYDEIFNHKVAEHSECYYAYSNDADEVRAKIISLLEK